MLRMIHVEFKKLYASKIWWLILAGGILPAIIAWLSLLDQADLTWQGFIHVAMLIFNVQSLLILSAFAAYLWAREYEENTIEISMCYPCPKHLFLTVKMLIMLLVTALTVVLFMTATLVCGAILLTAPLNTQILWQFMTIALSLTAMHFLVVPAAFLAAILTRMTVSGIIRGIIGMCMCMTLYGTSFIQFLPSCIPFVLSDHLLGMDVMHIEPNYAIHWAILSFYFIVSLTACYSLVRQQQYVRFI